MAKVTAAQWLQKWGQRLNASQQYITDGVAAVTEAPGVAAAAAQDRMLTNLTNAITSGLWAARVQAVSLAQWKAAMTSKGIPRIAAGVQSAQQNKVAIITSLLSAVDQAAAAANAQPKGSLEQNIIRAVTFMRAMSANAPRKAGA